MADDNTPLALYLAYYSDAGGAQLDYDDLKTLASTDAIKIEAIALITRDAEGKIDVEDNDHSGRRGAGIGAAVGLVVGAIFPPSLLGGAVAGGLVGGGTGSLVSRKHRKEIKADLEDKMPRNSSAVVAVFEMSWVAEVKKALAHAQSVDEDELDDDGITAVKDANAA
jgi:uncharacterized membrane protein